YPNQKFGVLANISSSKIPSKFEYQQVRYMIDFLYCVKCEILLNKFEKLRKKYKE
ncbi:10535_t:CDS:2, partial [Cetraspora pellucida]